ncbi:MAG: membrane protein insertion efficiency factor YidD [Firmicutes bacterium]|nr:membrane protein insertion efficiency factor YidD [Bacillota bacterium]
MEIGPEKSILGGIGNSFIKKYQQHVSSALADDRDYSCKYTPSCSHYTQDAIAEYGLIEGGVMGFMRIMRCHKGAEGGYDPVIPKDQVGKPQEFTPAHKEYHYESTKEIMAHESKVDFKTHQADKKTVPDHELTISEKMKNGVKSCVIAASVAAGGIAGAAGFAAIGGGLGAWLGTVAGRENIGRLNAKIAKKYSPESVYGFAKIENALGKPSYNISKFIENTTGSKTAARAVGTVVGGPVGLAIGIWKGGKKGLQIGTQYGRLFGKSVTSEAKHAGGCLCPDCVNKQLGAADSDKAKEYAHINMSEIMGKPMFESTLGKTKIVPLVNEEVAPAMLALLKSAKKSIDVEIFSIKNPEVIGILKDKAKEGVQVRLINNFVTMDGQEQNKLNDIRNEIKDSGIEVHQYPVSQSIWQFNHTKMVIVDDQTSIIGSKNWGTKFANSNNYEIAMLISGDTVDESREIFEKDWAKSGGTPKDVHHRDESPGVSLNVTDTGNYQNAREIRDSIKNASKSIDVGMYWLTDKQVIDDLIDAKSRGVNVRALISHTDENRYAKEKLTEAGIETRIFSHSDNNDKKYYHIKMGIFDGEKVNMGSCDWTAQGLYLNHELNMNISDRKTAGYMTSVFNETWETCASPDAKFAPPDELYKQSKIKAMNLKLSRMVPGGIAKAGMIMAGIVSAAAKKIGL